MTIEARRPEEKALVIGYGNPSRQDDGAGYHVVNMLNGCLGRPPFAQDGVGLDAPEGPVDTIWAQQLVPELAETISQYDMAVLVDAHTGAYDEEIRIVQVRPAYLSSFVSHHMKPETLLALARDLYRQTPRLILVSIRGREFEFGFELSEQTQRLAGVALEQIKKLVSL